MHTEQTETEVHEDDQLSEEAGQRLDYYSDRATFHRIEAERYERLARATVAMLAELKARAPVEALDAGQMMESVKPHV